MRIVKHYHSKMSSKYLEVFTTQSGTVTSSLRRQASLSCPRFLFVIDLNPILRRVSTFQMSKSCVHLVSLRRLLTPCSMPVVLFETQKKDTISVIFHEL